METVAVLRLEVSQAIIQFLSFLSSQKVVMCQDTAGVLGWGRRIAPNWQFTDFGVYQIGSNTSFGAVTALSAALSHSEQRLQYTTQLLVGGWFEWSSFAKAAFVPFQGKQKQNCTDRLLQKVPKSGCNVLLLAQKCTATFANKCPKQIYIHLSIKFPNSTAKKDELKEHTHEACNHSSCVYTLQS